MSLLSSFFKRMPDDPADQLIAWLSDKNLDDRRLVAGILYGGPHSLKVCKWILTRPDCDTGTAAMLLWEFGRPDLLLANDPADFPAANQVKDELVRFISRRWKDGLFADAVFAFDPREIVKLYRRELKKKGLQGQDPLGLPDAAWKPIAGRKPAATHFAALNPAAFMEGVLGAIRLADLQAINPRAWRNA